MTFRRWLAGLIGETSVRLQNWLYPNYTERALRDLDFPVILQGRAIKFPEAD